MGISQKKKIIQYMEDFGSISPLEAMKDLGVMRLAARISDLKDEGYEIHTEREKSRNRYGEETTYARYSLGGKK